MMRNPRTPIGLLALAALCLAPLAASAGSGSEARSVSPLVRPEGAVNDEIRGDIEMRSRVDRDRFKVQIRGADEDLDHDLYIENDAMVMEVVAELKRGASYISFEAELEDGSGSLPLDVASVMDLVGREVEVRTGAEVVLFTTIGDFSSARSAKVKEDLDAVDAPNRAEAEIRLRSNPRKGDERFRVKLKRFPLADGQALRLFVEDPDNLGTLVDVGPLKVSGNKIEFRARTKKGQALPFGVGSTLDLGGLEIEIRDAITAVVYFEGLVPTL